MPGLQLVVLALVQGITEFLPISSSGHLILTRDLAGWSGASPASELLLDVAVHVGTLAAVMLYFRRDVALMAAGAVGLARGRIDEGGRLALLMVAATVPVVIAGAALKAAGVVDALRSPVVIGWTTLGFGLVLYLADRACPAIRRMGEMKLGGAIAIGLAQVLALVPGTSRSGITMTAARALGFTRTDAAHFSMLLSIPVIVAAGVLEGIELYQAQDAGLTLSVAFAAVVSFIAALAAIRLMLAWLARASFTPFVVYRVALGVVVLALAY
jgi:undecaprenyl-diphosphatase